MSYQNYLVSNELGHQNVILGLQQYTNCNGIYIGIGTEQNFSYIAVTRPSFAFIVDNRKENQNLHYLFKACFELASSRQEYLSILFSKPLKNDAGLKSLRDLVHYFLKIEGDIYYFNRNWDLLCKKIQKYRTNLSDNDLDQIYSMYRDFFEYNLFLRTRNDLTSWQGWLYPTYRDFLLATDQNGRNWNFLNDDWQFQRLKTMQTNNLIIPIVGDLTGEQSLSTIAEFAKKRRKSITTIYISNAEQFIFEEKLFDQYMNNIKNLPKNSSSLLIRTVANKKGQLHPEFKKGQILTTVMQKAESFIQLYEEGRYNTYWDIATLDFIH